MQIVLGSSWCDRPEAGTPGNFQACNGMYVVFILLLLWLMLLIGCARVQAPAAKTPVALSELHDPLHTAAPTRASAAIAAAFHQRPQDLFDPPVDNSNTPFEPDLSHYGDDEAIDSTPHRSPARTSSRGEARLAQHAAQLNPVPRRRTSVASCALSHAIRRCQRCSCSCCIYVTTPLSAGVQPHGLACIDTMPTAHNGVHT